MALVLAAAALLTGFYATATAGLRAQRRGELEERARVCAVALRPASNGDLSDSVQRLRRYGTSLVAVATLGPSGTVDMVIPDRPDHRRAIQSTLADPTRRVSIDDQESGESILVVGVITTLAEVDATHAQKAVLLFKDEGGAGVRLQHLGLMVLGLAMVGAAVHRSLRSWHQRHLEAPLRSIRRAANHPLSALEPPPPMAAGDLREIVELSEAVQNLHYAAGRAEARARRIQRAADHHLRTRERGFHNQLRRVRTLATTDPLTKLRNRSFLEEELEPLFEHHRKLNDDVTAVMIDIDNFKRYNDSRGHQYGDALLRFVGSLLRGSVRPTDLAVRYGGDEFLLLLPSTDADQARGVADGLRRLFGQYTLRLGKGHGLSISAGIASIHRDSPVCGADLVARADVALYSAKRAGKNTVALVETG